MRASLFITFSMIIHVFCVTAIVLSYSKKVNVAETEMEMSLPAEPTLEAPVVAQAPVIEEQPIVQKPAVVRRAVVAAPAKPSAKKVVEIPFDLPAKAKSAEPQQLDPEIDEKEMVQVAPSAPAEQTEGPTVQLIPVKDAAPAGVEPSTVDETQTEATSEVVNNVKDPSPVTAVKAGSTEDSAVSYLSLKQRSGNKPPVYPLAARQEKRQGEVMLLYRVTAEGHVMDAKIAKSSGHFDLDQAALRAISNYKFNPGQESWARHPVAFTLKGPATTLPSRLRTMGAQTE